ncbi:MAG: DUF59 domain-containing protein, partial [Chloroflexi bacterium]|nr:DUF59 domain-containing protein [Chloroflexota bacterium]
MRVCDPERRRRRRKGHPMTEQNETSRTVTWEVDTSSPELAARAREALREVVDPEIGLNIVELGLIRNVAV